MTEYESQQEEECNDTFNKKCEITYQAKAKNETVEVCMNPLVKVDRFKESIKYSLEDAILAVINLSTPRMTLQFLHAEMQKCL